MSQNAFSNYLRTHRKRLGLTQKEMALLLGASSAEQVCRYERLARQPSLEVAMAYEAVCGASVREVFADLYSDIERGVVARANTLRLDPALQGTPAKAHVRQALERIGSRKVQRAKPKMP